MKTLIEVPFQTCLVLPKGALIVDIICKFNNTFFCIIGDNNTIHEERKFTVVYNNHNVPINSKYIGKILRFSNYEYYFEVI